MKNEEFIFLEELNKDLYKRYLMIEDALKNKNGNVYVEIQAYLENLFKYINKRENFNLIQPKTLGDYLKNYRIITFCLVRIEYNDIDILKKINYYGNNHKHHKVIEFKFSQFIKFIREIHLLSRKIYNYYNNFFVNNIRGIDVRYYSDLLLKEQKNREKQESYQSDIIYLSETITNKYKEITLLKEKNKKLENVIKQLQKEVSMLKKEMSEIKSENCELNSNFDKLKKSNKAIEQQLNNLRLKIKDLEIQNNILENYKEATEGLIPRLLKKVDQPSIIDEEVIHQILLCKNKF